MENLTIGGFDWAREEWEEVFFPEDLPHEWRLDFYSNEFHCALVPQATWMSWVEEDFEDLLESVEGQRFALYFAIETLLTPVEQKQLLVCHSQFYALSKGVVIWNAPQTLPAGCDGFTKTLLQPISALTELPETSWQWTFDGWRMSGDALGLVFNLPTLGRDQTAMVKSFAASLQGFATTAPLMIGQPGVPLEIEDLRAVKTIAELLGY